MRVAMKDPVCVEQVGFYEGFGGFGVESVILTEY